VAHPANMAASPAESINLAVIVDFSIIVFLPPSRLYCALMLVVWGMQRKRTSRMTHTQYSLRLTGELPETFEPAA
jgi:hypothetical protein